MEVQLLKGARFTNDILQAIITYINFEYCKKWRHVIQVLITLLHP